MSAVAGTFVKPVHKALSAQAAMLRARSLHRAAGALDASRDAFADAMSNLRQPPGGRYLRGASA